MKIITDNDVDYDNVEALAQIFSDSGLHTITIGSEGYGNARVEISFPSTMDEIDLNCTVMVWVPSRQPEILQFRVIILDKKERDELKKNNSLWTDIVRDADMLNENAFGFLSLSNMSGITLDYSLTIEGGIADSTLINTTKKLAEIAQGAKSNILDEISFAD